MSAARRPYAPHPLTQDLTRYAPLAANAALVLLAAFGVIIALRRIAIGQAIPMPLLATVITATVLVAIVLATRFAGLNRGWSWTPTAILILWGVACSFPGSQILAWVIWIAAVAIDWWVGRHRSEQPDEHRHSSPAGISPGGPSSHAVLSLLIDAEHDEIIYEEHEEEYEEEYEEEEEYEDEPTTLQHDATEGEIVLQHVVRMRDAAGREYIHATLRGELNAGERRTTLYVGFCPPLETPPQVEAEVIEGPPGVVKIVQSLHNGVQLEVDLDEVSLTPVVVTVEVAAFQAASE